MLNLPRERFIGQHIGFLGTSSEFQDFVQYLFDSPEIDAYREVRNQVNGEWRHYLIVAQKYNHNQAAFVVGIDITDRKQAEELAIYERDLAIILAQQIELDEALPLCLDLVLKISGMDCGGIYLVDRKRNGNLILMTQKGLSEAFVAQSHSYEKGSDRYQMVMNGAAIYQNYLSTTIIKNESDLNEGLRSFAMIPLKSNGEIIACINVASHIYDDIPESRRQALSCTAHRVPPVWAAREIVVARGQGTRGARGSAGPVRRGPQGGNARGIEGARRLPVAGRRPQ